MTTAQLIDVDVTAIVPSPDQNRETFDPRELAELAESIRELGLLQPVTIRPLSGDLSLSGDGPGTDGPRFVLIAGERRLRACRDILRWHTVPAIVRADDSDDDSALRTLAENLIRADTSPLEDARGIAQTRDRFGLEPRQIAEWLGKSARWVRERLSLLELADDVAHFVATGGLPVGRAVLMSELDVNRQRLALAAHERGIAPDAFRALIGKLVADQAADSMFDTDSFLQVEEIVRDVEAVVEAEKPAPIRERPCGISDIAEFLEVRPATVHQWRARGLFPEPEMRVGGSPAWWESTVKAWARETGR